MSFSWRCEGSGWLFLILSKSHLHWLAGAAQVNIAIDDTHSKKSFFFGSKLDKSAPFRGSIGLSHENQLFNTSKLTENVFQVFLNTRFSLIEISFEFTSVAFLGILPTKSFGLVCSSTPNLWSSPSAHLIWIAFVALGVSYFSNLSHVNTPGKTVLLDSMSFLASSAFVMEANLTKAQPLD